MKSSRGSTLLQVALLALALLGLGWWAWQRYHPPSAPTYHGRTLDQWITDLDDPDYQVSDRAVDVLEEVGADAVPVLLDAREQGDIRLHRRAVAALIRIGAPAAPGLVAALKDKPREQRIEVALVRLGPAAVPALRDALTKERGSEAAAHVLGLIGPPAAEAVPDLIALLQRKQTTAALRGEAAFALGRIGKHDRRAAGPTKTDRRDAGPTGDIVPVLIAALKDRKMEVRQQAADALGWIGPPAHKAVPDLVGALKDDEAKVAKKACQALSFIGDAGAAPGLLKAYQGDRNEVRAQASWALWNLGPKARNVLPSLLSLAQGPLDKTAPMRQLLASFGPQAVPDLVHGLHDDEAARREAAAEVLGHIGPPARPAAPALIDALKDKSSTVALTAAMALAQIDSTRARAAVPLLADSLDTPGAAQALANIGPDARSAVPALIAALKPRKEGAEADVIRAGARLALARIGRPAVHALIEALKDKQEGVAPLAGEALGWILPPPKEAVPALREALKIDRPHAAVYAHALGQLGASARPAVADLTELLADNEVRPVAAVALVCIDPDQAEKVVPLLVKDLQATEEKQRQAAILALGWLGPAAKAAAPALVQSLHDRQLVEAKKFALRALGAAAVPSLMGMLKDPKADFRRIAALLLEQIGPVPATDLTPLIAALSDSDREVRAKAAQVVQAIGPKASAAVPALIANLQASQTEVRAEAAFALGHLGPDAKEARRPLLECLLDPDETVRYGAALSLGRIDPDFREAAGPLRDALHDASPMVQLAAIDSLIRMDKENIKEFAPILLALIGKAYAPGVRFRAAEGLTEFTPETAKSIEPWLTHELTNGDPEVRLEAATLLMRINPERTLPALLSVLPGLNSPNPTVRMKILGACGSLGPKAREAVPEIERLLYDGTPGVREEAIRALKAINPGRAKQLGVG
ncbi:MAG TPA: HEAT repeat domain-containing protein [Gemmataceae bacterium]|nr:HEAT repeat domain-containing protein [Gemmataceae bacterium]